MTPDTHHPSEAFGACAEAIPSCQRESDYTFPPLRVLPWPCLPEHEPGGHCPSPQPHPASSPSFILTSLSGLGAHAPQGHLALSLLGPRLFLVVFRATGELSLAPSAKWHPIQVCRINCLFDDREGPKHYSHLLCLTLPSLQPHENLLFVGQPERNLQRGGRFRDMRQRHLLTFPPKS